MKKIAAFLGFEGESSLAAILGPLFLIAAIMLAGNPPKIFNYDLLFVAAFGLFLTAKWKTKGCIAALLLLAFSAGAKHVFVPHNHAWQAGLEASIGIALLISALVFEETSQTAILRENEIERNQKTILFIEEDLKLQKETGAQEAAAAAEKLSQSHLQIEEIQSEFSTLQVLNDVLRKAAAKAIDGKEALANQALHFDVREGQLLEEIDSLQKELARLANESVLVQQNRQLFSELNETRLKEAETHQVNQTLVRLHAKENQRARELEGKFASLDIERQELLDRIQNAAIEKENGVYQIEHLSIQLNLARAAAEQTILSVQNQIGKEQERVQALQTALELERQKPIHSPEDQEKIQSLQAALELERQKPALSAEEKERIQTLQTRIQQYGQMELLYRQIKGQFEEKNQMLHKTRSQLFLVDTELQMIKQQLYQKDLEHDPMPKEICLEVEAIEAENIVLLEENHELQDLVSHLMQKDGLHPIVKKKMKKSHQSSEQASLF